ncbi:MAG: type II toxin-antitoxin system VapC family toxin [Rhodomicrobium sp.]
MRGYLDANVLIALFSDDLFTPNAKKFLRAEQPILLVSDFACAEFASGIAMLVRMETYAVSDAQAIFSDFDAWTARATQRVETLTADVKAAEAFLRRLDLTLRAPDALHIAIAQRTASVLITFDEKMALCARALGMPVAP